MSEPGSLVERQIAQAFDDLLVNDDGAVPWSHIANARNEVFRVAAAELSTLRSRCETLERERDEYRRKQYHIEKDRAICYVSKDGETVTDIYDLPVERMPNGYNYAEELEAAEAARDEAVAALEEAREALRVIATGSGYEWSETREQLHRIIDAAVECASNALTQPAGKEKGE